MDPLTRYYSPKEISYGTHGFFKYPAKFIPQVAREFITNYSIKGDTILDPFCGSGTTLVEASITNRESIGLDVSPIACLIARAKTVVLPQKLIVLEIENIKKECNQIIKRKDKIWDYCNKLNPDVPKNKGINKWFQANMLRELSILQKEISKIKNLELKDFLCVAFLQTIKSVSNASQFYKLTMGKNVRTYPDFYVPYKFREFAIKMKYGMLEFQKLNQSNLKPRVFNLDSREKVGLEKVDFVIGNLPIFNRDYNRSYKIYHWWVDKNNKKKIEEVYSKIIGVKGSKLQNENHYFKELKKVLENVYTVLKPKRYMVLKCKDFVHKKQKIDTVDTILKIARKRGFEKEKVISKSVPKRAFTFAKEDVVEKYLVLQKK